MSIGNKKKGNVVLIFLRTRTFTNLVLCTSKQIEGKPEFQSESTGFPC